MSKPQDRVNEPVRPSNDCFNSARVVEAGKGAEEDSKEDGKEILVGEAVAGDDIFGDEPAAEAHEHVGESKAEEEPIDVDPRKLSRTPILPSPEEIEAHRIDHLPYADWCDACNAGRGLGEVRRTGAPVEHEVPIIGCDYFFVTSEGLKKRNELGYSMVVLRTDQAPSIRAWARAAARHRAAETVLETCSGHV